MDTSGLRIGRGSDDAITAFDWYNEGMSTTPSDAGTWGASFNPYPAPAAHYPGELCTGDEMSREEFHARYERSPGKLKVELVNGVVFVASPVSLNHGAPDCFLNGLLYYYTARTPGCQAATNTAIFLGPKDEPQPDSLLRLLPEFGGQSRTEQRQGLDYVAGAPELVVEVAHSSRAIDLHWKRNAYQQGGVIEYIVHCVEEKELRWFDLRHDLQLQPSADGVVRSNQFTGLWLNVPAVGALDFGAAVKTLEAGLASPEHAEFVARLKAQHDKLAAEPRPAE
jgi:Uma2 family endonuclease